MNNISDDLGSANADTFGHAVIALFNSGEAEQILSDPRNAKALEKGVANANRSAIGILLLSHVSGSEALLRALIREHGDELLKLRPWSRAVPLRLVADVALSRIGDRDARLRLLQGSADFSNAERVFLLDVLPEIDAPELWHAISSYLSDETEIPEGVPSGAAPRRVCDYAVDAITKRIPLQVSFAARPSGRYTREQIEETRDALTKRVPR